MAELERRGVTRAAACAFLDRGPGLALEVCGWQQPQGLEPATPPSVVTAYVCLYAPQVYTAARFDCGGEYEVGLALDGRSDPVPVDVLAREPSVPAPANVCTTLSAPCRLPGARRAWFTPRCQLLPHPPARRGVLDGGLRRRVHHQADGSRAAALEAPGAAPGGVPGGSAAGRGAAASKRPALLERPLRRQAERSGPALRGAAVTASSVEGTCYRGSCTLTSMCMKLQIWGD